MVRFGPLFSSVLWFLCECELSSSFLVTTLTHHRLMWVPGSVRNFSSQATQEANTPSILWVSILMRQTWLQRLLCRMTQASKQWVPGGQCQDYSFLNSRCLAESLEHVFAEGMSGNISHRMMHYYLQRDYSPCINSSSQLDGRQDFYRWGHLAAGWRRGFQTLNLSAFFYNCLQTVFAKILCQSTEGSGQGVR